MNLNFNLKSISKKVVTVVIGCLIGLILGELVLRIYNPLPSRIQGQHIRLETNINRQISLEDGFRHSGLDSAFHYSTNSIGFRGPEPIKGGFRIFTVGGSTTECSLLDDQDTWSAHLLKLLIDENGARIWVNNAGLDGSSTYGHQILLDEHLVHMKPDMIVFLVGANDLFQTLYPTKDDFFQKIPKYSFRKWMSKSELFSFLIQFYRSQIAKSRRVGHFGIDKIETLSTQELKSRKLKHADAQGFYANRLKKLIETCRKNEIQPVFITQPIKIVSKSQMTAEIEFYNITTRSVAEESKIQLIDLAGELNCSDKVFYDDMHYTKEGSKNVADIIARELVLFSQVNKTPHFP